MIEPVQQRVPFPCVFHVLACPHVHMFAPACDSFCRPASCVRTCPGAYVRVYVCVPGESVAGQRVPPDPGHAGGGDADDRQPLRLCFPPLLISARLQRLQGPPTRGTPPSLINIAPYRSITTVYKT